MAEITDQLQNPKTITNQKLLTVLSASYILRGPQNYALAFNFRVAALGC